MAAPRGSTSLDHDIAHITKLAVAMSTPASPQRAPGAGDSMGAEFETTFDVSPSPSGSGGSGSVSGSRPGTGARAELRPWSEDEVELELEKEEEEEEQQQGAEAEAVQQLMSTLATVQQRLNVGLEPSLAEAWQTSWDNDDAAGSSPSSTAVG